jgi:hypothetical protein
MLVSRKTFDNTSFNALRINASRVSRLRSYFDWRSCVCCKVVLDVAPNGECLQRAQRGANYLRLSGVSGVVWENAAITAERNTLATIGYWGAQMGSDTDERRWILIAQYWFRLSCLEHHHSGEFGRRAEPGKTEKINLIFFTIEPIYA